MAKKVDNIPPVSAAPRQIELLEHGYTNLALAQSIKDLGSRFEEFLRQLFPDARVRIAFRPQDATGWSTPPAGESSPVPPEALPGNSFTSLTEDGCLLQAVRRLQDGTAFWIGMSPGASAGRLTDAHNTQLRLALNIFDAACSVILHRQQEKGLVFSLNQRILQLNSLIDTGIEVAKLSAELSPHHMALERAAALTNASGACVTLTRGDSPLEQFFFPAGFQVPTASTTPGIHAEFTFGEATYTFELFGKESRNGHASFDGTDQLLLDALARQVHASLENRFLLQQSLEKQRIEQDITVAASIQQRLLPASLPDIPGYDAAGINIPSKSVGGDYYDCIPLPDRKYALVIADVAGKGVPAALLVSSLHAYLSAYLEGSLSLVDLTRRLNTAIHRASTDDKFITAFLGILDPETGVLEAVNAGHCTVYLRRADATILELSQGGIPFGMLGIDFPYQSETVTLAPGDRLFLYTDGITEAQDEQNRLYDRDGNLKTYFATHTPCDAQTFVSALISDVRAFMGSTPQADDITALYLMRNT